MNHSLSLTAALLLGPLAAAQSAASADATSSTAEVGVTHLADTVVTATRFPVPVETVGNAISVITADQIEQRQSRFVSDLLRDVPGVAVSRSGTIGATTQVRIRGAESNQTLVIIDGVKMNDPAAGGEFDFSTLLSADIERIEVLRGPQAVLYGSSSIGGVINIITRRSKGPITARARLEGGSFRTLDGGASISGGDDTFSGALSVAGLRSDGINISRDGNEEDDYRNWTINGRANYRPTDQLDLQGSLRYLDTRLQFDDFAAVNDSSGIIIPNDADRESTTKQWSGRAQARLSSFDGRWENTLGYSGLRSDNNSYADGDQTFSFNANKDIFDFQSNAYLEADFAQSTHDLTLLIEHQRESGDNTFAGDLPTIRNTGYALSWRGGFWDSVFLTAGGRYDQNSRFENEISPQLSAAYLHHDTDTRLHASWGQGVQNPNLNELFGFFGTFIGNPDLTPETSTGWDLGVEQQLLDQRVTVGATWFNNRIKDFISSEFDATAGASRPINLPGESKIHGIEFSASAALNENLSLDAAYTWTDGEDPDGETLVRRPRHVASASLNYTFLARRANLNLTLQYNGEQDDFVFKAPFFERDRATLDAYTLVNLAASYRVTDQIEVTGRIENLLNKDYEEVYGFQSPGIAGYLGVKGQFGL